MSDISKYIINGRFLTKRITGVERYAVEILKELDKIIDAGDIIIAVPPNTIVPKYINIKSIRVGKLHNRLWEHISFPIYAILHKKIPLNFCNVAPLLYPGVVFVHDVKTIAIPKFFRKNFTLWYKILFTNIAKRALRIITVSEFSKKEIEKYLKVNPNIIDVVPSAWSHYESIKADYSTLKEYGLENQKYYFSISSFEPNKNFKWIAEIAPQKPNDIFVIAGAINSNIFKNGLAFEIPPNMKLLGYISDEAAKALMKECKAFLFPTIYEGFGLPPLEAIGNGARSIVVSDTEVMHEIYGKMATYINPYTYKFDSNSLVQINEKDAKQLLEKYTWKNNAHKLVSKLEGESNE